MGRKRGRGQDVMGEELKTDVERSETRRQEIQEATVGVEEGRRAQARHSHAQRDRSAKHGWSKCSAHKAQGHRLQTVHTVRCRVTFSTIGSLKAVSTKTPSPPPTERTCQRSVTSSIYVH